MENKINLNRVLLGGIIGGIALDLIGFLVHGVLLGSNYMYFQKTGAILAEPRLMPVQVLLTVLSGIPLAFLYAYSRKHLGAGPKCAIIIGVLVGLMSASFTMALYSYYNVGRMIPMMTFVNNFVGYIVATLIAGALYKDTAEKTAA